MNLNYRDQSYYEAEWRDTIGRAFEKRFRALLLMVSICLTSAVLLIKASPVVVILFSGLIISIVITSILKDVKRYMYINDEKLQVMGKGIIKEIMGHERDFVFRQVRVEFRGEVGVVNVPICALKELREGDDVMLTKIGDFRYAFPLKYSEYS